MSVQMPGLLDSIKEIGFVPLLIPITALLYLAITLVVFIRRKKEQLATDVSNSQSYGRHRTTRELSLYARRKLVDLLEQIDQEGFEEDYDIIEHYLRTIDENFLLVLFGEFNTGKSSFINAFLGEEIVATGITPTTTTIWKISYGDKPKQEIVFHDGTTEVVPDEDALWAYLDDQERSKRTDYIWLFQPSKKLEKLDVIDTPGLNSLFTCHEETTLNFVHKADAVLWLFHPHQGGSESEKQYLSKIKGYGKNIIGIVSHKDIIKSDEDICLLTDFIRNNFGELIDRVFVVSAPQALESISSGHQSGYSESGLCEVEEYLRERIFDRVRRAKIEAAIASCHKSALHVSERMRNEVSEARENKVFWDSVSGAISKEALEIEEEICQRVARNVEGHFTRPREFARQRIKQICSWKKISYALLLRRDEVSFPMDWEFFGSLDVQGFASSIRGIAHQLGRRAEEMFKKVEMELMVEDEQRKRDGKRRLGVRNIEWEMAGLDNLVWNDEGKGALLFPPKGTPKAISVHLSVKDICGSLGRSVSEARKEMERRVFAYIMGWEWTCCARIVDILVKMNRGIKDGLVGYLTPYLLEGSMDPDEVVVGIDSLERRIKKIDDIVDDLAEVRDTWKLTTKK
jgi:GTPase SAR1 family protein